MNLHRDRIKILISYSGTDFKEVETILSYSITSSFLQMADTFHISLFSEKFTNLVSLTSPLSRIKIFVNDALQLDGRIDRQEILGGGVVEISGRDYLGMLVDSDIGHITLKKGEPVDKAVLKALKPFGIGNVEALGFNLPRTRLSGGKATWDQPLDSDPAKIKIEDHKSQPNETVFQFIRRLTQRTGFFIQQGSDINSIALCIPNYKQEPIYQPLIRNPLIDVFGDENEDAANNNILYGTVVRDYTKVPTYVVVSTKRPMASQKKEEANGTTVYVTNYSNSSIDINIENTTLGFSSEGTQILTDQAIAKGKITEQSYPAKLYRALYVKDSDSKSKLELQNFVKRILAEKMDQALTCEYEVEGHSDIKTGAIYTIDTTVDVDDEIAQVHQKMWIAERTFKYNQNSGATTQLKLMFPDALDVSQLSFEELKELQKNPGIA